VKYIIRHNFRELIFAGGLNYYVTNFFKKLHNELTEKYPEHDFEIKLDDKYEPNGNGGIYSCMNFSIINPDNNKYILISFWDDWKYHFHKHMGWEPSKMQAFYYCGSFNFVDYFNFKMSHNGNQDTEFPENINDVYKSFYYGPYFDSHYDELDSIYNERKNNKNLINEIKFRGFMWDHRLKMIENLKSDDIIIIDKNKNDQSMEYLEFLKELSGYKCTLSLPGNTNICNRDIECFAIGVPVLRPSFDNKLSDDPLHSDYHYLSFYHAPKYWDGNCWYLSYNDFKEHLVYYWEKVKNNDELLDFISENAYKWYKKNSSADYNIKYILSSLTLDVLN
jgi:hypothetical protein